MKKLILLSLVAFISACGQQFSGTYVPDMTPSQKEKLQGKELYIRFEPNGQAFTNLTMGMETEMPYKVTDEKVSFRFQGGGDVSWAINKDGSIDTGKMFFGVLKKK